ncbi:Myb_DNA-bind_3 domain-containing protein, partial [Cephalotus follicularis]
IVKDLNKGDGKTYTMKQVKQKYHRLRANHRLFSWLLGHTGIGWDAETNTVTAIEETWQNIFRLNLTFISKFSKKGCEHYKPLGIIFNKSTTTGVLHYASMQDPPNTDEENELKEKFLNAGVHI